MGKIYLKRVKGDGGICRINRDTPEEKICFFKRGDICTAQGEHDCMKPYDSIFIQIHTGGGGGMKTGGTIYANTQAEGKFWKVKMVVVEITEIPEAEYKKTRQHLQDVKEDNQTK